MSYHSGGSHAYYLVIPLEGSSELNDDSAGDQQADLRHFGVDDCDEGSIDMGEIGGSHLGFDDRSGQQSSPPVDVFVEELHNNILDVGYVDLIDDSINGFSEQFPHKFLMGLALGISLHHLLLQLSEFVGRHVDTTCPPKALGLILLLLVLVVLLDEERGLLS